MIFKRKKNYWQQDIKTFEYLKAAAVGIFLICIISYMFYGTFLCAILLSPYLIRYFKSWKKEVIKKKKQIFQLQFKEAILSLSTALSAGYSLENAIGETWNDLKHLYKEDDMIVREFRYMVNKLEMKLPIERVLREFATRVGDEDVQLFVTVFAMAKKNGGDMIEIIRNTAYQIGERIDVKREINTMMAAKKLEFRIMCVVPFAMICYLKISFPSFLDVLYGNLLGNIVMTACLGIYYIAFEWGKKIIEIEV